jgi:hypothetical protein
MSIIIQVFVVKVDSNTVHVRELVQIKLGRILESWIRVSGNIRKTFMGKTSGAKDSIPYTDIISVVNALLFVRVGRCTIGVSRKVIH